MAAEAGRRESGAAVSLSSQRDRPSPRERPRSAAAGSPAGRTGARCVILGQNLVQRLIDRSKIAHRTPAGQLAQGGGCPAGSPPGVSHRFRRHPRTGHEDERDADQGAHDARHAQVDRRVLQPHEPRMGAGHTVRNRAITAPARGVSQRPAPRYHGRAQAGRTALSRPARPDSADPADAGCGLSWS